MYQSLIIYILTLAHINGVVMKTKMLIRNTSYMKRELSDTEKELAMMDAKAESLEPIHQWTIDSTEVSEAI